MYTTIKSVIESGRYELTDMLRKIDTFWLQGDVTDEERTELVDLAREKALPENSYASVQNQIDALFRKQKDLEERIIALENSGEVPVPDTDEYPDYVQPTGAHDAYYNGDKMTYTDGSKYLCIAPEGVACVWGPDVMPGYWQAVDAPLTV